MALARFKRKAQITDGIFKTIARVAPDGVFDVFAADQHGSFLKMLAQAPGLVGKEEPTDDDVGKAGFVLAGALPEETTAALFNRLAFERPKFLEQLPGKTMLIARLERSKFEMTSDGKGQIPVLDVEPADAKAKGAKAVKTLVKLNLDHEQSWEANYDWLKMVWQKCLEADMPLFNEVLYEVPGATKVQMAKKLPEALVAMAEKFGAIGTFFKTQAPLLWAEDEGELVKVGKADTVREVMKQIDKISPLPVLLLSAAVDFDQYMYQFCLSAEYICGPMCGRAYFKEAPKVAESWSDLQVKFKEMAHPRMAAIRKLTEHACQPWWKKMTLKPKGKKLIQMKKRMKSAGGDVTAGVGAY